MVIFKVFSVHDNFFLNALEIFPNDPIALYNLSCVQSLIGNIEESVSQLKKAIHAGYNDLEHMTNDQDFINIRNTSGFEECINLLSSKKENVTEGNSSVCPISLRKKLYWMHRKALKLMEVGSERSLNLAKELLSHLLSIEPNEPIALYNLACTESLLGNIEDSLLTLKSAIDAGYNDVEHMIDDSDFENIKHTEGFLECIRLLSNRSEDVPQETEQRPETTKNSAQSCETTPNPEQPSEQPTQEPEEFSMIKNILLEMGILIDEEKLHEICSRFQNDLTQIVNYYFMSFYNNI